MTAKTAKLAFPEAETPEDGNTQKNKNTHTTETPEQPVEIPPAEMPVAKPLNVHQRMLVAQRIISTMPFVKDLKNSQYASVPIDKVRRAVREACTQAGMTHAMLDVQYTRESRGTTAHLYGSATVRFYNADDPSDFFDHPTIGHAMDNGDKDVGKLMSNLAKVAYKEIFGIGEQSQDDIDAYSNEVIEEEAERIEAIRARRKKNLEPSRTDPFFGDDRAPLRKRIGAMMSQDKEEYVEGAAPIVEGYKAQHGLMTQWSKEVLEQCIRDIEHEGEVKAAKDSFWGKEGSA